MYTCLNMTFVHNKVILFLSTETVKIFHVDFEMRPKTNDKIRKAENLAINYRYTYFFQFYEISSFARTCSFIVKLLLPFNIAISFESLYSSAYMPL